MNSCTVTTLGRLPYARVLADTFLANHPGSRLTILVLDDPYAGQAPEDLPTISPAQIGIGDSELHNLAMLLDLDDLVTAYVPKLLEFLVETTGEGHTYLADDVCVYGNLEEIEQMAKEHGLVLSQRTFSALPDDDLTPDQAQLLNEGLYNPGLIAVDAESHEFLKWWSSAMQSETRRSLPTTTVLGHADRHEPIRFGRILDMATGFRPGLLDRTTGPVTFWNAWELQLQGRDGHWQVEGAPLLLFRFEGFDPEVPHLLATSQGTKPRVLLSQRSDIARLTRDYAQRLFEAGFKEACKVTTGFEQLPGGLTVDRHMRYVYRKAYRAYVEGNAPAPPDPFDRRDPERFIDWLNAADPESFAPKVPRYLMGLYEERLDLKFAFPGLAHADADRYLDWVVEYGAREHEIPQELCRFDQAVRRQNRDSPGSSAPPGTFRRRQLRPAGLNVAGYFKAESGVGEMARLIMGGIEQSGEPYSTFNYQARFSRQNHDFEPTGEFPAYSVNLICVNADELYPFVRDTGEEILDNRYTVGMWWWELEEFPEVDAQTASLVDEVWVGTEHVAGAVRAQTDRPVHRIPVPIRKIDAEPDRKGLGLPEGFVFLFTFDFLSAFSRKNPLGIIEAFSKAFEPNEGPTLVIKSINGMSETAALEIMRLAAANRSDILMIDGYLPPEQKDALTASCDCYVSLHRAEGYGLGMAEAIALGKPVIATNYSGNLAFLNDQNSYLVDYELSSVPSGTKPYREGARWADPDLDQAAKAMRGVYYNQQEAAERGRVGREQARSIHTPEKTAEFIRTRMAEIRQVQLQRQKQQFRRQLKEGFTRRVGFTLSRNPKTGK